MPARSAALPPPDPHAGPHAAPHVAVIEGAHADLGLGYDEIARALGANASTLHRWRAGDTGPSPVFRHRLRALAELTAAARGLGRRRGLTAAAWLDAPAVDVPGLGGERPRAVLAIGQLERLAALLTAALPTALTAAQATEIASEHPPHGVAAPAPPGRLAGRLAGRRR